MNSYPKYSNKKIVHSKIGDNHILLVILLFGERTFLRIKNVVIETLIYVPHVMRKKNSNGVNAMCFSSFIWYILLHNG